MPASRNAAATTRLPRSWPSKPILVTSTLGITGTGLIPPPPIHDHGSNGPGVGGHGSTALVDPRKRGPSPFASCCHLLNLAMRMRILALPQQCDELARDGARIEPPAGAIPALRPVQGANQHQPQHAPVSVSRKRQVADQAGEQRLVLVAQLDQ